MNIKKVISWIEKNIFLSILLLFLCTLVPIAVISVLYWVGDALGSYAIKTRYSSSEILSYYSTILGTLIGAIATFIALYFTIQYEKKELEKDRRLQIAPYVSFIYKNEPGVITTEDELDYILYKENKAVDYNLCGTLHMKNVGMGPLLNCCISNVKYKDNLFPRFSNVLENNALEVGKKWDVSIGIGVVLGEIPLELMETNEENRMFPSANALEGKSGYLTFKINYEDIIETPYEQDIKFRINVGAKQENNSKWEYYADMYLDSISPRKISYEPIKNLSVPIKLDIK